ncbi:MAG: hypothetical protein K2X39_00035, partial [Silvanigrellaceae bacterium]|nr:hypothetical protein [Silvanigrellaceae bacterium]
DAHEKQERIQTDMIWAERFLHEPWEELMHLWDSQEVFCQIKNPFLRQENYFQRHLLAQILKDFSLGKQDCLWEQINKINIPLLWISGEMDKKFSLITKEVCTLNSNISSWISPKSGHRIPWENPAEFQSRCLGFLNTLL